MLVGRDDHKKKNRRFLQPGPLAQVPKGKQTHVGTYRPILSVT